MNSLILDIVDKIKTIENNDYYCIKDVVSYYDLEGNLRVKIIVFDTVENKEKTFVLIMELIHELDLDYVKKLENGLINALDELFHKSKKINENFDYYDKLRELTGMGNYQALDFLDMFSDNEYQEKKEGK